MSVIEDLERKVQSLESQLSDVKQSLYNARIELCHVKVGDIVQHSAFNGTKETRKVAKLTAEYRNVCLYGYKQKANGEWGGRVSYIGILGDSKYGWDKVKP